MKPCFYRPLRISALIALLSAAASASQAQEVYGGLGLFGVQLGYAHAINPHFTVRIDHMTAGTKTDTSTESGTTYQAKMALTRTALLADYFPGAGGFRLTAGLTSNNMGFDLTASGVGNTVDIDNNTYTLDVGDSMNVKIKLPSTAPYVGIGYGHQKADKGWGFHADLGVIVGSFKVSEKRTGQLANGGTFGVTQTQVDNELVDLRDSVSKLKVFPQLTMGVSYRF